jgi:hypothetical protein
MARPIETTPVLNVDDSARLASDLREVCSPQEADRRIALAQERLAAMMMPGWENTTGSTPKR